MNGGMSWLFILGYLDFWVAARGLRRRGQDEVQRCAAKEKLKALTWFMWNDRTDIPGP
jgi:hypothetical protein